MNAQFGAFLARLLRNEDGSVLVYMTLAFTVFVGVAGLATEGALWLHTHRAVQSAADNAAYSAATAYALDNSSDLMAQARAIVGNDADSRGLNAPTSDWTVTVNRPPSGDCYAGTPRYTGANAIEVIVIKPRHPLLSRIWLSSDANICGRAVAMVPNNGACILALATTGPGITANGNNLNINLTDCGIFSNSTAVNSIDIAGNNDVLSASSIGAAGGISLNGNQTTTVFNPTTGDPPLPDPYASDAASWPGSCSGCTTGGVQSNCNSGGCISNILNPGTYASGIVIDSNFTSFTMNPGTYDLGGRGFSISATANVQVSMVAGNYSFVNGIFNVGPPTSGPSRATLSMGAGTYYFSGNFNISGDSATVTGNGVTMVLTGNNSAITTPGQSPTINLTAPTSGWNAGIAVWEPISTGNNTIGANSATATIQGLIYAPGANMDYEGNTGVSPVCTQIVSKTINLGGSSINLTGDCGSVPGVKVFGQIVALVE